MHLDTAKHRLSIGDLLFLIDVWFISGWYILPAMNLLIPASLIVIGQLLLLLFYSINRHGVLLVGDISTFISIVVCSIAISLLYFFHTYSGSIEKASGIITQTVINFGIVIVPLLLYSKKDVHLLKIVLFGVVVMLIFVGVTTIKEMIYDPHIVRTLAHGDETLDVYRMRNVGGFSFCYGICFVGTWLVAHTISQTDRRFKTLKFFLLLLIIVFEAVTQYFIAVFILLVSIVLAEYKKRNGIGILISAITIIVVVLVLYVLPILEQSFDNGIIRKLQEIGRLIFYNEVGSSSSMSSRLKAYSMSINLFFQSPLIGAKINGIGEAMVGRHSSVFDTLAKIGIIGAAIYFLILKKCFSGISSILAGSRERISLSILIACYILSAILNPVFTQHGIQYYVFSLLPCLMLYHSFRYEGT